MYIQLAKFLGSSPILKKSRSGDIARYTHVVIKNFAARWQWDHLNGCIVFSVSIQALQLFLDLFCKEQKVAISTIKGIFTWEEKCFETNSM
jgi:hypothetical protein